MNCCWHGCVIAIAVLAALGSASAEHTTAFATGYGPEQITVGSDGALWFTAGDSFEA